MSYNPDISIIVPVYNVERYLRECLDSIKSQTFSDWECILVDDGSPDKSIDICEEYASTDSRFKVIRRQNGGQSAARNTGLQSASGKFIAFVDTDDVIHPRYLEKLRDLIDRYDADVSQVSYELLYKTFVKERKLVDSTAILNRGEVVLELIKDNKIPSYVWNKLFRREVIDEPFPEGLLYEDIYAIGKWVRNINRMVVSPDILYSYRQRLGSTVNSEFAENRLEYIREVIRRAMALRSLEPLEVTEKFMDDNIWIGIVRAGKNISRHSQDSGKAKKAMMRLSHIGEKIPMPSVKNVGLKTWWRAHLLRDNPMWFMNLVNMDKNISARHRRDSQYMFD